MNISVQEVVERAIKNGLTEVGVNLIINSYNELIKEVSLAKVSTEERLDLQKSITQNMGYAAKKLGLELKQI